MIREISKFTFVLAIGALLSSPAFSESHSPGLAGFRSLELPQVHINSDNVFSLLREFASFKDIETGQADLNVGITHQGDELTIDLNFSGYLDDSVSGENYRLVVHRGGDRYVLVNAGVQFVCGRGPNKGIPQTGYCP